MTEAAHPHPHHHPITQSIDRALGWHRDLSATIRRLDGAFSQWHVGSALGEPWRRFVEAVTDHMRVEEELLFPGLRALAAGEAPAGEGFEAALDEMRHEIAEVAQICGPLRAVSTEAGELEPDLLELLEQIDAHAEREQNLIQPEGARLLAEWRQRQTHPEPEHAPPTDDGVLFRVLRRLLRAGAAG